MAKAFDPAVSAGLLAEHADDSAADYSFRHEQVRDFAAATLTAARRRAIHAALVQLLLAGEPSPASLPLLAHHAKAAGDAAVCVRFSVEASRNALAANAPDIETSNIWIDAGEDDPWLERDTVLHEALLARGIAHNWNIFPGAHDGDYWTRNLPAYLRFYDSVLNWET